MKILGEKKQRVEKKGRKRKKWRWRKKGRGEISLKN